MVFDLNEYTGRYDGMCCDTEEKAQIFLEFLHKHNRKWYSGKTYLSISNFGNYKSDTIYYFNDGTFGNKRNRQTGYKQLHFDDFDWDVFEIPENVMSFDEILKQENA